MSKIYIETTVISYYTADRSSDIIIAANQLAAIHMWKILPKHEVFISTIVIEEAAKGDKLQAKRRLTAMENFNVLGVDSKAIELTEQLTVERAVPEKFSDDALHIAIAAVNEIEFLITFNLKHINNLNMRKKIRLVVEKSGYIAPEICSPTELESGD